MFAVPIEYGAIERTFLMLHASISIPAVSAYPPVVSL